MASSDPVQWTTVSSRPPRVVRPPDTTLVGLAAIGAVLLVAGQLLADLAGRDATTGWRLAVDAAIALVPAACAVALVRRPKDSQLRFLTLTTTAVALGAAFVLGDDRASAAACAVPPCLVLVACRPRWRLPRTLAWRRVGGAALGLVVGAGLLFGSGEGRDTVSVRLISGRLSDAQDAIGQADARFLADSLGATERAPGARCYFVRQTERDTSADLVACGPVVHPPDPDVDEEEPAGDVEEPTTPGAWDLYPVHVEDGDLRISDPQVGQDIDPSMLHRPDGLRPSGTGDAPAQAATVRPGFTMALSFEEPEDARPAGGFVLAGLGTVTISQVAAPETVIDENGIERRAPEGYRLVAAELAFEEVEGLTLEVLAGGDRVDLSDVVAPDGEFLQDGWYVAAARDDGVEPLLEVSYRGRAQRLSLETGERVGGDALLYAPLTQTIGKIVDSSAATITVPLPTPHTADVDFDGYTIETATLTTFDANLGWAPPGQAWLTVAVSGLGEPSFFDIDSSDIPSVFRFDPTRSFALQPEGADLIAPAGASPDPDGNLAVVFPVPDRTRDATFRATPTWHLIFDTTPVTTSAPRIDTPVALR